jgi:hypothetical protein
MRIEIGSSQGNPWRIFREIEKRTSMGNLGGPAAANQRARRIVGSHVISSATALTLAPFLSLFHSQRSYFVRTTI